MSASVLCKVPVLMRTRFARACCVCVQTERQQAEYSPKYQRFLVTEKRFTQQYSHLYMKRTEIMKPTVQRAACTKWSIDSTAV